MAEIIAGKVSAARAFLSLLAFVENASWDEMHAYSSSDHPIFSASAW